MEEISRTLPCRSSCIILSWWRGQLYPPMEKATGLDPKLDRSMWGKGHLNRGHVLHSSSVTQQPCLQSRHPGSTVHFNHATGNDSWPRETSVEKITQPWALSFSRKIFTRLERDWCIVRSLLLRIHSLYTFPHVTARPKDGEDRRNGAAELVEFHFFMVGGWKNHTHGAHSTPV